MKTYNEKGQVAVLYSPGYGAGWSTWRGQELQEFMLFDSRLVEAAKAAIANRPKRSYDRCGDNYPEIARIFEEAGHEVPYLGGWRDIDICWMEPGTAFQVDEYDGLESIQELGRQTWVVA